MERSAAIVMAGCHTLAFTDGILVGDPIEKQTFAGMKFKLTADGQRMSSGPGFNIHPVKKYMFESALKRMSVLCKVSESSKIAYRVLSKGAPEVLKNYMKNVPADYDAQYLKYVKDGARVLALAQKTIPAINQGQLQAYKREDAESDLEFVGFIIAECPLKEDTAKIILELK